MIFSKQVYLWFLFTIHIIVGNDINKTFEQEINAKRFLNDVNNNSIEIVSKLISSDYLTNRKYIYEQVKLYYPWKNFTDPDVRRKLKLFSEIGILALSDEDYERYQKIISEVRKIEQTTVICNFRNKSKCDLHLQPDIEEKLKTSQNSDELLYLHKKWHESTDDKIIQLFKNYILLSNRAANLNNYTDFKKYSLRNFIEMGDVKNELISLWDKIKPLYEQLHAYVRRKLLKIYGDKIMSSTGPIPAYLLGDIRLENWSGLSKKIVPFPEVDNLNITKYMIEKKYTPDTIHNLAQEYFESMNISVNYNFWINNSMEQKEINQCPTNIFNFYDGNVRIMDCNGVSLNNFLLAHNLVTKAHYMVEYSKQPYVYQMPADPALEMAINDIIAMSASTLSNLKRIGLFEKDIINKKIRINKLFKLALEKVVNLPFFLVQELWRWKLFEGMTIEKSFAYLRNLRETFQGIVFPFELGSGPLGRKAFSDLSLVHNFLGYFLEFQIYDNLCKDEINLDECNLADNKDAGMILRKLMSSGSSKSLKETLAGSLNESKIKARSIIKFFKPLMNWLKQQNNINEEYIGWKNKLKTNNRSKRRKRSAVDYFSELDDEDDTFNAASKVLNKFQRSVPLNNEKELLKLSTRKRKNVRNGDVGEKLIKRFQTLKTVLMSRTVKDKGNQWKIMKMKLKMMENHLHILN
ncbi:Angiotensin-converting enzyme precursor, putative [Pediculus humanus corporis]|uniref:Angiotensin-converting enzyme n=1 Tax=Pediculus humanus subsp. corporis TaxID=121224 RepID=E0VZ00_PEDHC|nr:Angiotensin-converting enzyme precursor, putative [Pediculus humanus corporis]EEB18606.1 Angiotensin-converting enzyme precursor, putative [Pediculus humanus corporis]